MERLIYISIILGMLFGKATVTQAQFSTDDRQLEEHMRYSRDKSFNTWSIAFGYGPLIMQNDLTSYAVFPDKHWKFAPMLKVSKQLHPAWAIDLQLFNGDFRSGNEEFYSAGNLTDYSINAITYINQWFAYPGPMRDRWNLFMKLGVGVTSYRTRVHYTANDNVVHYRDWASENADGGYLVLGYDKDDPYKKTNRVNELVVPLSAGVQYRINRSFDIGLETSIRWSLEDKLDNVLTGADNDKYWYTNIHLAYKIGKKDKRHSRWTHRGYGFNVFDKPRKDPLADEVALLEEELRQLESERILTVDSITIKHHAQRIYGSINMVSVYFDSPHKQLTTKDQVELATIGLYMAKNPNSTVDIYAYNNSKDNKAENLEISAQRCQQVLSFFVDDLGINEERFNLHPKGDDDELMPEQSKNSVLQMINRRADIVVSTP
ncbi:OmpA family protein [Carboxylicivirga taeanensis]|uniref:OmpA family protein n=1 Tax=Carboxylicivirga taeanensis TaxID=1416875 RepID=UPI003F6E40D5